MRRPRDRPARRARARPLGTHAARPRPGIHRFDRRHAVSRFTARGSALTICVSFHPPRGSSRRPVESIRFIAIPRPLTAVLGARYLRPSGDQMPTKAGCLRVAVRVLSAAVGHVTVNAQTTPAQSQSRPVADAIAATPTKGGVVRGEVALVQQRALTAMVGGMLILDGLAMTQDSATRSSRPCSGQGRAARRPAFLEGS